MEFAFDCTKILDAFNTSVEHGWGMFLQLEWPQRDEVTHAAITEWPHISSTSKLFLDKYKMNMHHIIREDFYDNIERIGDFCQQYKRTGEINIPLLKLECLNEISEWSFQVEELGNSRYGTTRTVYPPGEVKRFEADDPRKQLCSEVNMVAVASRHMQPDDIIQWIYHSPHLQIFVRGVMGFSDMYPYENDLGVAVNIARPRVGSRNSLGFHFDSIDSAIQVDNDGNQNAKGATGVIGVRDCSVGGERITFPSVSREKVSQVEAIVNEFDPINPCQTIAGSTPVVVQESIAGVLSVFNGGNVLHCVSSVREGERVAAVFLYSEKKTSDCESTRDSANAFYGEGA